MSSVNSLSILFEEATVRLDKLLFDPNNPRLFGIPPQRKGWRESVPLENISQTQVQNRVYQEMLNHCDVMTIKDSIIQVGYIPIDRMVVRPLNGTDHYVVVEGNRRLAAMKLIQEETERGGEEPPPGLSDQFDSIPVLVYQGSPEDFRKHRYTLQGIRHIGGIRGWGPYERGLTVQTLSDAGKNPQEIKKILLLRSVIQVNRVLRTMNALEQMKEDEEYGEFATPDHYTHMEEAVTKTKIKEWLDWYDTSRRFRNIDRFREFLSWFVVPEDRKIFQSIQIRMLPIILENEDAIEFLRTPGVTITEAHAYAVRTRVAVSIDSYRRRLEECVEVLRALPAELLTDSRSYELLLSIQKWLMTRIGQADALRPSPEQTG